MACPCRTAGQAPAPPNVRPGIPCGGEGRELKDASGDQDRRGHALRRIAGGIHCTDGVRRVPGRWTPERKDVTYATPTGMKCRCGKLYEQEYRKENLEHKFTIRKAIAGGIESAPAQAFGAGGPDRRRRDGNGAELGGDPPDPAGAVSGAESAWNSYGFAGVPAGAGRSDPRQTGE